jgi:hypothetical protein
VAVRSLSDDEVAAYDVLPPALARRARLVRVPALPGGYSGMTLGRWILLRAEAAPTGTSALVAHELVHVRQWHERGVPRFLARYLADFARGVARHRRWRAAYRDISLEVEARAEAQAWSVRTGGRRPPTAGSPGQGGEALP